jgi:hypothetical protein
MSMGKALGEGIQETMNCYQSCSHTIKHCLEMGGEHAAPEHIKTLMDCAKICVVASDFMLRESEYHVELCTICADICHECAESCDAFEDEFMKNCAKQCRTCAKTCRDMVG